MQAFVLWDCSQLLIVCDQEEVLFSSSMRGFVCVNIMTFYSSCQIIYSVWARSLLFGCWTSVYELQTILAVCFVFNFPMRLYIFLFALHLAVKSFSMVNAVMPQV